MTMIAILFLDVIILVFAMEIADIKKEKKRRFK